MVAQLQALLAEIDACSEQAKSLLGDCNESQIARRPSNGGWSAVECVKHLTLTADLYLNLLPPLLKQARDQHKISNGPYKMDWKGRLLKWVLEPPYRTKVKTLKSLEGVTDEPPKKVLAEFLASQERLKAIYTSAQGLALDKTMMQSPFDQKVRYNLFSCFCVIPAHQRRHLWQGEQARLHAQQDFKQ